MFINIYTFATHLTNPAKSGYHADQLIIDYGSEEQ